MSSRWEQAGAQAPGSAIGLPPLVQRPAIPIRARLGVRSWITLLVIRPSWLWRRELAAVLVLAVTGLGGAVASWSAGAPAALWWAALGACPPVVVVCWLAAPVTRRASGRWWRRARLGRRWDAGCRWAGLTTVADRIPRITAMRPVPAGERLRVRVPKGSIVDDLEDAREHLAAYLRVREVRVTRDGDRANLAHVEIVRRDPFASGSGPLVWPWLEVAYSRLWSAFPIGVDEAGEPVDMRLIEKHVLLGGEPGSGKSAGLSLLLAAAALDPHTRIWGLDAKRLELALWRPVLERVGFQSIDDAIAMVEDLIEIMDERYEHLETQGLRTLTPDFPLYVLCIDELRFYTAHADSKKRARFNVLLIDLAARGRAAGIIVLAATQKPSTDVVPSSLRDLLAYRWAMRCTTRDASDTILGAGWATSGFSAADIDASTRGVGWLLAEGGQPVRLRSYYLTDDHVRRIAARGAALRCEAASAT